MNLKEDDLVSAVALVVDTGDEDVAPTRTMRPASAATPRADDGAADEAQ